MLACGISFAFTMGGTSTGIFVDPGFLLLSMLLFLATGVATYIHFNMRPIVALLMLAFIVAFIAAYAFCAVHCAPIGKK